MAITARRALWSFIFFLGGVNVTGLGIIRNGEANLGNPTWRLFSALFELEFRVLEILAGVGVIGLFLLASCGIYETANQKKDNRSPDKQDSNIQEQKQDITYQHPTQPAAPVIVTPKVSQAVASRQIVVKPREPLTAEELKQQAIEQILRGY